MNGATTLGLGLLAAALLAAPAVMAQNPSPSDSTTLTGCLENRDGAFALTNAAGHEQVEGKRVALEPAEGVNLSGHVGHTVEVNGRLAEPASDEPTMQVSGLKHVSASCS